MPAAQDLFRAVPALPPGEKYSPIHSEVINPNLDAFRFGLDSHGKPLLRMIFDFLFHLMKAGRSRSTIRLVFSALRSFYQFLVTRNYLQNNVITVIDLPKPEKQLLVSHPFSGQQLFDGSGKRSSSRQRLHGRRLGMKRFSSFSIQAACSSQNW